TTNARMALPCFDEPEFKAVFTLSIITRKNQTVLSNTTWLNENNDDFVMTSFEPTPPMSTNLLAIVVGEYDYIEDFSSSGVKVRVYTGPGRQEEGRFALKKSAMENWGLVIFRETALLATEGISSTNILNRVAVVVAHEIAHTWFGNLVTMDWWTYLWLNEGFATWISYLCVDNIFPEYDIWSQFQINEISVAMNLDSLQSSHPIEIEIGAPSEADEIFDKISYAKGSSIISYLYEYIGDTVNHGIP
ncbi:puromycin-sensitive aminopeptidase-like protein, partial [Octopus sinensis]|uniref:Puromycin-sensitive aminopeptidase-like protein n=1 Tax=Octopus sinensis TaxID=2607531 RepID=A0A6P7TYN1_9MOLL